MAVGLLALAFGVVLSLAWHERLQATHLRVSLAAERLARTAPVSPVEAPLRPSPAYAASANEMLAESNGAAFETLTALEQVARVGVTPVAVELSAKERSSRVDIEFSDYAALLAYRNDLDAGNPRPEWSLESAQAQPNPGKPGRAVLLRRVLPR